MIFPLDLKAIGYGFATFIAGWLAMSVIGTGVVNVGPSPIGTAGWSLFTVLGYMVPVVAGYVAAYRAPDRRVLHGTIGGAVGVLLFIAPVSLVPGYSWAGAPVIIASYAVLASLGAILGKHRRDKVGE
ncbi:hypothetical protein [Novilysobacter erysipheiresistens]|uniref:SPW repeat-containing protein n=1 Tax=Novilysobacter erysipheiresistens TaxID=1749332 RepID=A0ABU7YVT0_9GAMM